MIELTDKAINPSSAYERIKKSSSGSVVFHFGVVKQSVGGRKTRGIHFEPNGDLESELKSLEKSIREKWKIEDFLLIRRIGDLEIGDVILLAAASAEGRDDAFGACRDAVEGCKKLKNMAKKELFED